MLSKHLYKWLSTVTYSCKAQRSGVPELYNKLKLNRLKCFLFMAGLWFNFTSNDIAKLDMVNLQYFHWRLGSDILSKWNFPVVPNTFYLISMLAVWNVIMHCHNDRWAKAQESNRAAFSNEPCLANVKIHFCPWLLAHSQVLTVTGGSSVMWLHAGWNIQHEIRKLCTYVYLYSHY